MRDDIQKLFSDLIVLYKNKLQYINKLNNKEKQIRYALISENTADMFDLISDDKKIIDIIDLADFDIRRIKDKICRISGIEYNQFSRYFLNRTEEPFFELSGLMKKISEVLSALASERDKIIIEMDAGLGILRKDIISLQNVIRLSRFSAE